MLQHLLYLASPTQISETREALARIGAHPIQSDSAISECYRLEHRLLEGLVLNIYLLSDLDGVTPHLKQFPVDLLIYDERGADGINAYRALKKIHQDVLSFAQLWGPDFLFPMSRTVAILDGSNSHRAFELGRIHVRDVYTGPKSTARILYWLKQVLSHGVIREDRVGVALSGGGLDGMLFQLGCVHALEHALEGRSLSECDAYSGISSGSIVAGMLACDIPCLELIKAIHKKSDILPEISSSTIFELAGRTIAQRMVGGIASWGGLDPANWLKKFMRSVPTGFFRAEKIQELVSEIFTNMGKNERFDELARELYIGATDQDSFEHVIFGTKQWRDIRVSEAIAASCAFPPIFTPQRVRDRFFIDGQVTKTCNPEILAMKGCRLIFIIDPVQPFATHIAGSVDREGGIHATIQVVKALVYTRFHQTLTHLTERFPDIDFIVFQPDEKLAEMMSGSPMRYRFRTQIISHGFRGTLRRLRERHHVYENMLQKYGFQLKSKRELLAIEREENAFSIPFT